MKRFVALGVHPILGRRWYDHIGANVQPTLARPGRSLTLPRRRAEEQSVGAPTSFHDVGPNNHGRWPDVGPTLNCYLGKYCPHTCETLFLRFLR